MSAPIKTPLTVNDALNLAAPLCADRMESGDYKHHVEACGYCEDTAKALMAVDCASRLQSLEEFREFLETVIDVADDYSDGEYVGEDCRPVVNKAMHLMRDAEELLARLAPDPQRKARMPAAAPEPAPCAAHCCLSRSGVRRDAGSDVLGIAVQALESVRDTVELAARDHNGWEALLCMVILPALAQTHPYVACESISGHSVKTCPIAAVCHHKGCSLPAWKHRCQPAPTAQESGPQRKASESA